jgi:hypothetical protein
MPIAVDVELHLPEVNTGTTVQVFASDANDFTRPQPGAVEMVLTVREERAALTVNGNAVALPGTIRATPKGGSNLKVSMRFDREMAIVDVGGRRLYAGPHGLAVDKARYAGIRFVRGDDAAESAAVRSIVVSRPAALPAGGR